MVFGSKRILITGGAGYLASSVIKLLQDREYQIIRFDRPGTKFMPLSGRQQLQDIEGDIRDRNVWESAIEGVDIILHFAAQTSVYVAEQNPVSDLDINVIPMIHLLETCRNRKIHPIIIFAGTTTEFGLATNLPISERHPDNPITVYDIHKLMAEKYLLYYIKQGFVRGAVLRLANVYGPGPKSSSADRGVLNRMIHKALQGETLTVYGEGICIRDYIYIADVANAFLNVILNIERVNGQYFVIGSGQGNTIDEAINLVADRVALRNGHRVPVVHIDPPESLSPIESRSFIADTSFFTKETEWKATVSLTEGIDRTIEFFLH